MGGLGFDIGNCRFEMGAANFTLAISDWERVARDFRLQIADLKWSDGVI
jgi:hypothetical protein